jgi:hypothetical protein
MKPFSAPIFRRASLPAGMEEWRHPFVFEKTRILGLPDLLFPQEEIIIVTVKTASNSNFVFMGHKIRVFGEAF